MAVSIIVAIARNGVIGASGRLPWRIPEDLARFKSITLGHAVIMGRATWQSIGRPLPGRLNIVLSRDEGFRAEGCSTARSIEQALEAAGGRECFAIGGASVYALFLPIAVRMFVTHIDADMAGDTLFPEIRWEEWRVVRSQEGRIQGRGLSREGGTTQGRGAAESALPFRFVDYERKSP